MRTPARILGFFIACAAALAACGDDVPRLSPAKEITSFSFTAANNRGLAADVKATINGDAISATVPSGTAVTGLVATFETTGQKVTIGAVAQISGSTANNFSSPVSYLITARR
jgi:trimeric autotransporter adhesin